MAKLAIGDALVPFTLVGVDGNKHGTSDYAGEPVLAVIFWCNHCPYVQAWEERVLELQRQYAPRGVQFLFVSSNDPKQYPEDDLSAMRQRAEEKRYPAPYLFDETQQVAAGYGASRTPEIFLFDSERKLRYHGRPDDNYEDPAAVRHHYLRDAIEAVLAAKRPAVEETEPQGCTIKWRR